MGLDPTPGKLCHHRPASKAPFKLRFAGGLMVAGISFLRIY